jgi:hypothetical protein
MGATAPARCYTAPRMRPRQTRRPRVQCPCESPAKRRDGDGLRGPETTRPGTTVQTRDDVHDARLVERMLARRSPTWRGRRAAVRETPSRAPWRRPDPNDPDARSGQMPLFFARCCDGDNKSGVRPGAAICPALSKQPDTAPMTKGPQNARMRNDPKSFVLCPYNVRHQPRRSRCRRRRRLHAVLACLSGCKVLVCL